MKVNHMMTLKDIYLSLKLHDYRYTVIFMTYIGHSKSISYMDG